MNKKRNMLNDKKGQGLSTNAIILIILGIIVLVILVIGFMMGWTQLRDLLFKSNNVDSIVKSCDTACTTNSKYEFCSEKRELKADVNLKDVTCYYLATNKPSYGINPCNAIDCGIVFDQANCAAGKSLQIFDVATNTLEGPTACSVTLP